MKTKPCSASALSAVVLTLGFTSLAGAATVRVMAPAELAGPLRSLELAYETSHPGRNVDFDLVPARRLEKEASSSNSDLVISRKEEMDFLSREGIVASASVSVFAVDRLALVTVPFKRLTTLQDLTGDGIRHIAIVNPSRGGSGMLAVLALNRAGVWSGVQPRIVHADNATEVLESLTKGAADAALVYVTDTIGHDLRIVGIFERPYSDPIRHCVALSSRTRRIDAARDFQEFLSSDVAQGLLSGMGYRSE